MTYLYDQGYNDGYEDSSKFWREKYAQELEKHAADESKLLKQIDTLKEQAENMDWRRAHAERQLEESNEATNQYKRELEKEKATKGKKDSL